MSVPFEKLQRQLGRLTIGVLAVTLVFFLLAVFAALLGLPQAVVSFRGAAASTGYVFCALFGIFLLTTLTLALVHRLSRRNRLDRPQA